MLPVLRVMCVVALGSLFAVPAGAGEKAAKKKEVVTSAKSVKSADKDPNIKTESATNDKKSVPEAPPEKGGKGRGIGPFGCRVTIDNWTGYIVNAYVDGNYVGVVGRFGDGSMFVGNGPTLFYARANFDDGTSLTWGPAVLACSPGGQTTWKITN